MEWLAAVGFLLAQALIAGALLTWRDRRRGPVCPWCGESGTFVAGEPEVCNNCGFDFRRDKH